MNKRKYLIIILLCILMIPTMPIGRDLQTDSGISPVKNNSVSAITARNWYNVTYANITYGTNTTNIWGAKEMDLVDNTNSSFIEDEYTYDSELLGESYTSDASLWNATDLDNLQVSTFTNNYYVAPDGLAMQFTTTAGTAVLAFDNGTGYAMSLNVSTARLFHIAMRSSSNTPKLVSIEFHNTAGKYYLYSDGATITATWHTYEVGSLQRTAVGGMLSSDVVNWIEFHYNTTVNNVWLYVDSMSFSGATLLGDAYTDNIIYWDPYFGFKTPIIVAGGVVGANCYRVTYDANLGIPILRFDNNTANVANMDISEMDHFKFSIKAGVSGSRLLSITFYNTPTSYFVITPSAAITTSWVTYDYTRADYTSVGGMTAADSVNWIDFRFTEPQNKELLYLDAPMFYSNMTSTHRFDASFNFTGIGVYDNYALNITAATNVTTETMQISNNFDAAVYDLTGTGTWETFSIYINETTIQNNGYLVVFINSTLLSDLHNSTLDIDLFQVYAWNETNIRPVILGVECIDPDEGDNMYAGYKNYTITANVTDANGFADISYISVGFKTVFLQYPFILGWYNDADTFIEETNPGNVTIQPTLCNSTRAGNNIDLTFSFTIEVASTGFIDMILVAYVNDTAGAERSFESGVGIDMIVATIVNGTLSSNSGAGGETIYASGTAYYYNSSIGLASDYYDIWCWNSGGYGNFSDTIIDAGGIFNITVVTTTDIGTVDYEMCARAEGGGVLDTDYTAINAEASYTSTGVTVDALYNVTGYTIRYGHNTTAVFGSGEMDDIDATNASFIEDIYTYQTLLLGEEYTANASLWNATNMDNLQVSTFTDQYYVGPDGLKMQFTITDGTSVLCFDNGTTHAMNLNVSSNRLFHVAMRSSSALPVLFTIEFHSTSGKYFTYSNGETIGTTWNTYEVSNSQMTAIGGMTILDAINWIDFYYTGTVNNAWLYIDSISFSVATIFGDVWTDTIDAWNLHSRFDTIEVVDDAFLGAHCIRANISSEIGTPVLRFDNNTANVANIDISDINSFNFSIKASVNGSILNHIIFYNSESTYFIMVMNQSVTTTWEAFYYPVDGYTSVGGMTQSSAINWIDFVFTDPHIGTWIYLDAMTFYGISATRRLNVVFNFDSIAPFEHYALNISASTNVTLEDMIIFNVLNPLEVYALSGVDIWENYSMIMNATVIQSSGYLNTTISDTSLDDPYNSILDINLFQIYAWNSSGRTPSIEACYVSNIEPDDTMYAGYRNYTIVQNVTDLDGFADLSYIRFGLETIHAELLWAVGWFEDNSTFVKELYPDPTMITLYPAQCSNISSGNTISVNFTFMINVLHGSQQDINLFAFANDSVGLYTERHYRVGYDVEVGVTIDDYTLSSNRGNPNVSLYATGDAHYTDSNLTLNKEMYELWVTSDSGLVYTARTALDEATYGRIFNITDIPTPTLFGEYVFSVGAKAYGDDGTGPFYYDVFNDTYICDNIIITLTPSTLSASNGANILVTISAVYRYDGADVTDFSATISLDGVPIGGTYNHDGVISLNRTDTTLVLAIDSFTDNIYGVTEIYTSDSLTLSWSAGGGGGGGGGAIPTTTITTNTTEGDLPDNTFITTTINWGIIGVVAVCLGYVGIFGIGGIKGLGGKTAIKYRNNFIKWIKKVIKMPKSTYRSTTKAGSSLSSRLPSGKRVGSYRIKLNDKWKLSTKQRKRRKR